MRRAVIDGLRTRIQAIERPTLANPGHGPSVPPPCPRGGLRPAPAPVSSFSPFSSDPPSAWRLGIPNLDEGWLAGGLSLDLHEVKPAAHGDWAGTIAFALALAGRRSAMAGAVDLPLSLLWCCPGVLANELGRPYAPALAAFGIDPARVLLVEAARASEALCALEEGVRSACVAVAIGVVDALDLTPARRLSLACAAAATPCLLLSAPATPGAGARTRWRIAREASAPHPLDPRAPGLPRWRVALERHRHPPVGRSASGRRRPDPSAGVVVEWCDATHSFRLAAPLADRVPETPVASRRAS